MMRQNDFASYSSCTCAKIRNEAGIFGFLLGKSLFSPVRIDLIYEVSYTLKLTQSRLHSGSPSRAEESLDLLGLCQITTGPKGCGSLNRAWRADASCLALPRLALPPCISHAVATVCNLSTPDWILCPVRRS